MTERHELKEGLHIGALERTERIFLWSIRAWYAWHADLTAIWPSLEQVFTRERMHCALAPFHEFMSAVFQGLNQWPDIRCTCSAFLGSDEARLLKALSWMQRDEELAARRELLGLLSNPALRAVIRHGAACVKGAGAAGLQLPRVAPEARSFVPLQEDSARPAKVIRLH